MRKEDGRTDDGKTQDIRQEDGRQKMGRRKTEDGKSCKEISELLNFHYFYNL